MMAAIRLETTGPTLSSRNLAILHLAMYDAVNSVTRSAQPYSVQMELKGDTSASAAAAAAGYEAMRALYPSLSGGTEILYETQLESLGASLAVTNGLLLGRDVARAMLELRAGDGSSTLVPYIPSAEPGQWRRTPPFFRPPLDPHWGFVKLFALPNTGSFIPPTPPSIAGPEYGRAFNQVKQLGSKQSLVRTKEQTEIAVFWSDFSYTVMPPGHWHEIAASIMRQAGYGLDDCARLFALIGLAQADSAIVCWATKFRYNTWRPSTAIERADEDSNPETAADKTWSSLLNAPPFPEYTSGHSTFSSASSQVLARFLGSDAIAFSASSDSLPGVTRSFTSLAACTEEIGMSRIYGGIHFEFGNREGKKSGAKIGNFVGANYLLLNEQLPTAWVEESSGAGVRVRVHGHLGKECQLEASDDLVTWEVIGSGLARIGGFVLTDAVSQQSGRFYRVFER